MDRKAQKDMENDCHAEKKRSRPRATSGGGKFAEVKGPRVHILVQVKAVLSQPYLTLEEERRHAVERRSEYVPLFIRQRRNKWMKREETVFPALKRGDS